MSVDNTSSHSKIATDSARTARTDTAPNTSMLREAFANAMRLSLGHGGTESTVETTLFQEMDSTRQENLKQENNKDKNQQEPKNELSHNTQRKLLDRSELRHEQLQNDYQDHVNRRDTNQFQHDRKIQAAEQAGQRKNNVPALEKNVAWSETVGTNFVPKHTIPPLMVGNDSAFLSTPAQFQDNHGSGQSDTMGPTIVSGDSVTANVPLQNIISSPTGQPQVFSGTINSTSLSTSVASVLTIFTASGRMETEKREIEERKATEERKKEKKKEKTAYSFSAAVFETFRNTSSKESTPLASASARSSFVNAGENEAISCREAFPEQGQENEQKNEQTGTDIKEDGLDRAEHWEEDIKKTTRDAIEQRTIEPPVAGQNGASIAVEDSAPESSAAEQWDRIQLVQRIAAACQSAANQNGTIRVKLNLDQFGSVTIRMTHRENRLSVRFETTSVFAADYLRENIDLLKSTLEEHHMHLDQAEFEVVDGGRDLGA